MTNDHIKADISFYLSESLSESRRRDVEAHLATCEKCRQAVSKARSKLARSKREALKKAYPDRVPNLLATRLGKQAGLDQRSSRSPWGWVGVFFLVAGAGLLYRRWDVRHSLSGKESANISVSSSTTSAPAVAATTQEVRASTASATEPAMAQTPQQWTGSDSGVKDYREIIIKGRMSWGILWDEMKQEGPVPPINFREWLVVGIFAGEKASGARVELSPPIDEESGQQVVHYKIISTSTSQGAPSHPYMLMTIPRGAKKIRLVPAS